jgi:hypothetical protein
MARKTTKADLVEAIQDKGPLNAKEVHGKIYARQIIYIGNKGES